MDFNQQNRRRFIAQLGLLSGSLALAPSCRGNSVDELSSTSFTWNEIRKQFPIAKAKPIQLNSGSASTMPFPVQKKLFELIKQMNSMPPYEAFISWQQEIKKSKQRIASMLEVSANEVAFVRNTTEALNNVLFGYPLEKGDEIVCADWDYPFPHFSINQRVERDGIVKKQVSGNLIELSDDELIDVYKNAITDKTKLILLTHITHREGHILPVKKICKMAHEHGVEVLLDSAHAFAHIQHSIKDIGCDYYGTSLHKWLNAPHGTGLLYVKQDKISKVYPLSSCDEKEKNNIIKFEYIGTRSFAHEAGIGPALDFLEITGLNNKQNYLQELKQYWTDGIKDIDGVEIHTNTDKNYSCALASFDINKKMKAGEVYKLLETKYNIHAKPTGYPGVSSYLRVTPNIFTSYKDLDQLISAVKEIAQA